MSNNEIDAVLHSEAYEIYKAKGQTGVEDWAAEKTGIVWKECEPCESSEPHQADVCLVCGTTNE